VKGNGERERSEKLIRPHEGKRRWGLSVQLKGRGWIIHTSPLIRGKPVKETSKREVSRLRGDRRGGRLERLNCLSS